ncbi:Centlein [Manis pentadactyla]|nr:Centlein [Manis pentadactyla]
MTMDTADFLMDGMLPMRENTAGKSKDPLPQALKASVVNAKKNLDSSVKGTENKLEDGQVRRHLAQHGHLRDLRSTGRQIKPHPMSSPADGVFSGSQKKQIPYLRGACGLPAGCIETRKQSNRDGATEKQLRWVVQEARLQEHENKFLHSSDKDVASPLNQIQRAVKVPHSELLQSPRSCEQAATEHE